MLGRLSSDGVIRGVSGSPAKPANAGALSASVAAATPAISEASVCHVLPFSTSTLSSWKARGRTAQL